MQGFSRFAQTRKATNPYKKWGGWRGNGVVIGFAGGLLAALQAGSGTRLKLRINAKRPIHAGFGADPFVFGRTCRYGRGGGRNGDWSDFSATCIFANWSQAPFPYKNGGGMAEMPDPCGQLFSMQARGVSSDCQIGSWQNPRCRRRGVVSIRAVPSGDKNAEVDPDFVWPGYRPQ